MANKWGTKKLEDCCKIVGGGTPSKTVSEYYGGNILWATVGDMNTEYLSDTQLKINNKAIQNSSTNVIPKGNIIVATRVGLGKVCVLEKDAAINQDLKGIIPVEGFDTMFLFYYFKSLSKYFISQGTGATVKGFKLEVLKNLDVPNISIKEQNRIVKKLNSLFKCIDDAVLLVEKNIKHSESLMNSVLDTVFSKCSENNPVIKISGFAKTKSGGTPSRAVNRYWGGKIVWLKSGELDDSLFITENSEFITDEGLKNSSATVFKKGTLLLAMYGATAGKLGILGMDASTNQAVCSIQNTMNKFNPVFLFFYLYSIRNKILEDSTGGAQPNISKGYIDELEVPLPSLKKQDEYVAIFLKLDETKKEIISKQKEKLMLLHQLKSSLLNSAFKGEL